MSTHSQPSGVSLVKPPKLGLVIVDMQEHVREVLAYDRGNVMVGLYRVVKLIEKAKELNIPTLFLTMVDHNPLSANQDILPELRHAAAFDSRVIVKGSIDGFKCDEFNAAMVELELGALVLAGFHQSVCVFDTAKSGVASGIPILTSFDVLFGRTNDAHYVTETERRELFDFYYNKTQYHNSLESLLAAMESLRNQSRNAGIDTYGASA